MYRVGSVLARTVASNGFGSAVVIGGRILVREIRPSNVNYSRRLLSSIPKPPTNSKVAVPPEDFYDEKVEEEKELLDQVAAMEAGVDEADDYDSQKIPGDHSVGLGNLTTKFSTHSYAQMDAVVDAGKYPSASGKAKLRKSDNVEDVLVADEIGEDDLRVKQEQEEFEMRLEADPSTQMVLEQVTDADFAASLEKFGNYELGHDQVPQQMLSYNLSWRRDVDHAEPAIANGFLPRSDPELYRHDAQSMRSCTGKKQRSGVKGELGCHLIDLNDLSSFDTAQIQKFLSPDAEILSRKITGLCAKCQRKVAQTVKRARNLGMFPHINEYVIRDHGYRTPDAPFHKPVNVTVTKVSKTII